MPHYIFNINDGCGIKCELYVAKNIYALYKYMQKNLDEFINLFKVMHKTDCKLLDKLPTIKSKKDFTCYDDGQCIFKEKSKKNLLDELKKIDAKEFFKNLEGMDPNASHGYDILGALSFHKVKPKNI
ncbi:hypothetical protein QJ854_gp890 [Moumouvirus goulette]|uniref:Uncharacterized protein n=1 Tax=Moumouvirus goulette TaxID=1247379 RepID=M1PVZ3_9VIRU|nr:hypothetical protein QJ854_gp890 [Moumouvirus goulette]AGF84892.1 hypothetical protein glt_00083 [Moumouvirus goulette]